MVLAREINAVQFESELVGNASRILQVRCGLTVAVVVFPVRHVQALDGVALTLQQQCGDRGIDPAGQGNNDEGLGGHAAY
jgi:hypothetical protein